MQSLSFSGIFLTIILLSTYLSDYVHSEFLMSDPHEQLLAVVRRLLDVWTRKPGTLVRFTQPTLISVCDIARTELLKAPTLIDIPPPVYVASGFGGHFFDLLSLFERVGHPPASRFLFLGGYVGAGTQNVEALTLLLAYRILYPDSVFLLRGPSELADVNAANGFRAECAARYSIRLWNIFNDTFNALPLAASIGGKIFAAASGLAREHDFLGDIERPIARLEGPAAELLGARPDSDADGWVGGRFGVQQAREWLDAAGFDVFVCAGPAGLEFPFEPERCVVRIGSEADVGAKGCVMEVGEGFECAFVEIGAMERRAAQKRSELDALLAAKNPRFAAKNRKW